MVKVNRIITS